ncbi:MAG TPA: CPBP family intramembrane glutamic endopeptidase [Verrucomicrobiae bacterium]|nr:CPBP family intramembrane glutamic endopeptidase [Verrucomicrobiae bacterium]
MPQPVNSSQRLVPNRILIGGLILYAFAFGVLLRNKSFEVSDAIVVLIVFGIVFPFIAWIATRRAIPLSISVTPSKSQLIVLIGYIILLSAYLIGGPQWIDQHLPSSWTESVRIKFFITLTKKLVVFVVIPFAIFRFGFGYRIRDFGIQREGLRALLRNHLPVVLAVGGAFLAFQYFLSGGGAAFRHGHFTVYQLLLGLPLCFIWLFVEAGLVEEFFFRALVQSHLAAAFKSEVSGVVLMSLIFGLAHAPGFIFRHAGEVEGLGSNPSALDAVAYSIVVLAVSGVTFGVIWARTKNLFAIMLIHAAGDLLPNFAGFTQTWL